MAENEQPRPATKRTRSAPADEQPREENVSPSPAGDRDDRHDEDDPDAAVLGGEGWDRSVHGTPPQERYVDEDGNELGRGDL